MATIRYTWLISSRPCLITGGYIPKKKHSYSIHIPNISPWNRQSPPFLLVNFNIKYHKITMLNCHMLFPFKSHLIPLKTNLCQLNHHKMTIFLSSMPNGDSHAMPCPSPVLLAYQGDECLSHSAEHKERCGCLAMSYRVMLGKL